MRADILDKDFLNVQSVISKELINDYLNSQCKLAFPVKTHESMDSKIVDLGD